MVAVFDLAQPMMVSKLAGDMRAVVARDPDGTDHRILCIDGVPYPLAVGSALVLQTCTQNVRHDHVARLHAGLADFWDAIGFDGLDWSFNQLTAALKLLKKQRPELALLDKAGFNRWKMQKLKELLLDLDEG